MRSATFNTVVSFFLLIFCLALFASVPSFAQTVSNYNPRDDQYLLLGLKRAKDKYEVAKDNLERNRELLREGHISQSKYDELKKAFAFAKERNCSI